jgi:hypothetical protein
MQALARDPSYIIFIYIKINNIDKRREEIHRNKSSRSQSIVR